MIGKNNGAPAVRGFGGESVKSFLAEARRKQKQEAAKIV
jgi:hypothetical protein